jgi:hypothetical protein
MIWFDKRRKKFADMTKKRLNFVDKRRHNNDKVYLSNHLIYMHYDKIYLVCVCVTRCQRGTVDLIFVFYLFDCGKFFF